MSQFLPIDAANVDAEVRSYIYQTLQELEPYSTAETEVLVVAKDPWKGKKEGLYPELEGSRDQIRRMSRIAIVMKEGETKIEAEGLSEDIYTAIRMAKDNLLKHLHEIHNEVVSSQERHQQIRAAQSGEGQQH